MGILCSRDRRESKLAAEKHAVFRLRLLLRGSARSHSGQKPEAGVQIWASARRPIAVVCGSDGQWRRCAESGQVLALFDNLVGVSADLAYLGNSTVQANYYWYEGQHTLTISWGGGTFDKFGSE